MSVERYDPARHYTDFCDWYRRHTPPPPPEFLPKVGFVSPGVAMAFLYQTDSKLAYFEGMVANPKTTVEQRSNGLDEVAVALIAEARKLGFKVLVGQTDIPAVVERALRFGFVLDPVPTQTVSLAL